MMTTGEILIDTSKWEVRDRPWSFFHTENSKKIEESRNDDTRYNKNQSLNDVILSKVAEFLVEQKISVIPDTAENQYWIRIEKEGDNIILIVEEPCA